MAPAQIISLWAALAALSAHAQEISLTFHGGARQVGGSCQELQVDDTRILLDYGLFHSHGEEAHGPEVNENVQPFDPAEIDSVLISHVHVDHIGRLPLLYRSGYRGPVHATRVSCELARTMLGMSLKYLDLGEESFYGSQKSRVVHLRPDCEQGRQISRRNWVEFRTSRPRLERIDKYVCSSCIDLDAADIVALWVPHDYGESFDAGPGVKAWFLDAGHVPGSAMTVCEMQTAKGPYRVAYSGDYGNGLNSMLNAPVSIDWAQALIVESTYGGGVHEGSETGMEQFHARVADVVSKGGRVVIPSFTFDRSQKVLQAIGEGQADGTLPAAPVWLSSRSADGVTGLYRDFHARAAEVGSYFSPSFFSKPFLAGLRYEVVSLSGRTELPAPVLIVATSADGQYGASRDLFERLAGDSNSLFVNVGWAPPETPSGQLRAMGADTGEGRELVLDGRRVPFKAGTFVCHGFSAHADQNQVAALVTGCARLEQVFLVHGDGENMARLAGHLEDRLPGLAIHQPALSERFELK